MTGGYFISFEGGEGCGKSTQIRLLAQALQSAGYSAVVTREPGGVPAAEALRRLLVEEGQDWGREAETLLFYAARLEHVRQLIQPSLEAGEIVLSDRFSDSTAIYQGIAKGVAPEFLRELHRLCLGDFAPDLTLVLDIDPETGLSRAHARRGVETRFESLGLEFHSKVREGFRTIAAQEVRRCVLIDASGGIEEVHRAILDAVRERLHIPLVSQVM